MLARFHVLAGDLAGFRDAIAAMEGLVTRHWDHVNPRLDDDGDPVQRRNAIEALDSMPTVVLPFQHAVFLRDRRLGGLTLRRFLAAEGRATATDPDPEPAQPDDLAAALAADVNDEAVREAFALVEGILGSLGAMDRAFASSPTHPGGISVSRLEEVVGQLRRYILAARPDLAPGAAPEPEADLDVPDEAPSAGSAPASPVPTAAVSRVRRVFAGAAEIRAALMSVEDYFVRHEPSNPALVLVHQARILVGRPLTEALDVLMPREAENARLRLLDDGGMHIDAARMRDLTTEVLGGQPAQPTPSAPAEAVLGDRLTASELMRDVESFMAEREPSSPIPMLLAKARGYLAKPFADIVRDLLAR